MTDAPSGAAPSRPAVFALAMSAGVLVALAASLLLAARGWHVGVWRATDAAAMAHAAVAWWIVAAVAFAASVGASRLIGSGPRHRLVLRVAGVVGVVVLAASGRTVASAAAPIPLDASLAACLLATAMAWLGAVTGARAAEGD